MSFRGCLPGEHFPYREVAAGCRFPLVTPHDSGEALTSWGLSPRGWRVGGVDGWRHLTRGPGCSYRARGNGSCSLLQNEGLSLVVKSSRNEKRAFIIALQAPI